MFLFEFPVIKFFGEDPPPRPSQAVVTVYSEPVPPKSQLLRIGRDFVLDAEKYRKSGERDAILASSGMGKSYLAGVMAEEMLETGNILFIIDPEGENYTLAERYPMLIVGGEHANVELDLDTADDAAIGKVVEIVLTEGASIIFDVSGRDAKNQQELFVRIVGTLFSMTDKPDLRRTIKLIVEEARVFAPQDKKDLYTFDAGTSLGVFVDVATRGRKRGINFLLATQRPASVNKNVLSQCNRFWFGGVSSTQDCKALKDYLEAAEITVEQIRALTPGNFYFYSHGQTTPLKVRKRKCRHGGETPETVKDKPIAKKKDIKNLIGTLNAYSHE